MAIYRLERKFFTTHRGRRNNNQSSQGNNYQPVQNRNNQPTQGNQNQRNNNSDGYKKLRDRIEKLENSLKEKTEESKKKIPEEIDTKKFLKRAGLGIAGAGVVAGGIYGSYKLGEKLDKNKEGFRKEKARSRMLRGLDPSSPTNKN